MVTAAGLDRAPEFNGTGLGALHTLYHVIRVPFLLFSFTKEATKAQ